MNGNSCQYGMVWRMVWKVSVFSAYVTVRAAVCASQREDWLPFPLIVSSLPIALGTPHSTNYRALTSKAHTRYVRQWALPLESGTYGAQVTFVTAIM